MWVIFLALGLSGLISVGVASSLNWPSIALTVLFSAAFLAAIYKDSKTPETLYAWPIACVLIASRLLKMVEKQSSFIMALVYFLALCLVVYSAWQLYLGSSSKSEVK